MENKASAKIGWFEQQADVAALAFETLFGYPVTEDQDSLQRHLKLKELLRSLDKSSRKLLFKMSLIRISMGFFFGGIASAAIVNGEGWLLRATAYAVLIVALLFWYSKTKRTYNAFMAIGIKGISKIMRMYINAIESRYNGGWLRHD